VNLHDPPGARTISVYSTCPLIAVVLPKAVVSQIKEEVEALTMAARVVVVPAVEVLGEVVPVAWAAEAPLSTSS
jgi:hypothetical protein